MVKKVQFLETSLVGTATTVSDVFRINYIIKQAALVQYSNLSLASLLVDAM